MSVYVVDTGEREVYVIADADYVAAEAVAATGESVVYAEHYSDDDDDIPTGAPVLNPPPTFADVVCDAWNANRNL